MSTLPLSSHRIFTALPIITSLKKPLTVLIQIWCVVGNGLGAATNLGLILGKAVACLPLQPFALLFGAGQRRKIGSQGQFGARIQQVSEEKRYFLLSCTLELHPSRRPCFLPENIDCPSQVRQKFFAASQNSLLGWQFFLLPQAERGHSFPQPPSAKRLLSPKRSRLPV